MSSRASCLILACLNTKDEESLVPPCLARFIVGFWIAHGFAWMHTIYHLAPKAVNVSKFRANLGVYDATRIESPSLLLLCLPGVNSHGYLQQKERALGFGNVSRDKTGR